MTEHDKIIKAIQEKQNNKFKVVTNPSSDKRFSIQGLFPDVILMSQKDNKIAFIIEVETEDTIDTSIYQWKAYSEFPYTFYIMVPENSLTKAKQIVYIAGLKVKFGSYVKTGETFTFKYE